ncbi:MAG: cytochrome c [Nitrospiraceae bacterium]
MHVERRRHHRRVGIIKRPITTEGQAYFHARCAGCHGLKGKGDGYRLLDLLLRISSRR